MVHTLQRWLLGSVLNNKAAQLEKFQNSDKLEEHGPRVASFVLNIDAAPKKLLRCKRLLMHNRIYSKRTSPANHLELHRG